MSLFKAVRNLAQVILDIVMPPHCISCGVITQEHGKVCADCWKDIKFITNHFCKICGMPFEIDLGKETTCKYCTASKPKFAAARSACVYDGNTRKIAVRFKFRDGTYLAPHIASFMLNAGRELLYKTDVITAVPLHYNRQLKRKYNQASLLAKHLAKQTKIAYEPFLLKRIKSTKQQTKLNKKQRTENVEDAFQASDDFNYRGKTIMIVDDVMTTGATINECAKALKQKGAKKVYALTFARVNSVGG